MTAGKELCKKLQEKGYRMTRQRLLVFNTVLNTPQSATEIMRRITKKGLKIDKVTIYRILDLFVQLGFVGKTYFKGKATHYELCSQLHHHHLICNRCNKVEDISLIEDFLLKEVEENTTFRVDSHYLEFFGACIQCQ
ncbi:MAG TPA: Fur family transcriptional regulator [Patescibacteria group bacterium]|nr:Fur family transcriptional regulator [Patescibacteria group bacterium]